MKNKRSAGHTMVELLIASSIALIVISALTAMWLFAQKNWAVSRKKIDLHTDLEVAIEKIKYDVRLSTPAYILTSGHGDFSAVSIALSTPDAEGFYAQAAAGGPDQGFAINWDKSVIYHTYTDPDDPEKLELRKTVFTNNEAVIQDALSLQQQVDSVCAGGDATGAPNGEHASTTVMCKNVSIFEVRPVAAEFDGYSESDTAERSDCMYLGQIALAPGPHTVSFVSIGKNDLSSGYYFGLDSLSIMPAGYRREIESYTPTASNGKGYQRESGDIWGDMGYLEYQASEPGDPAVDYADGDYIEFSMYYDACRESDFYNTAGDNFFCDLDNTARGFYIRLAKPFEGKLEAWDSEGQTGAAGEDYLTSVVDTTIRNIVRSDAVGETGQLIRFKFTSRSDTAFIIEKAFIHEFCEEEWADGDDAVAGSGKQIYFHDAPFPYGETEPDGGGEEIGLGVSGITIPAGQSVWSNWIEYELKAGKSYFVTFYVETQSGLKDWPGGIVTNSYSWQGDYAATDVWTSVEPNPPIEKSFALFGIEAVESWTPSGTATSEIYDTRMSSPDYRTVTWDGITGSGVEIKVRSGDDENMADAKDWDKVASHGSGDNINPGKGRYFQFRVLFEKTGNYHNYASYPFVDNVTVKWTGETDRICEVTGYFAKRSDYGMFKILIDERPLVRGIEIKLALSYELNDGYVVEASARTEVRPRN